MPNVLKTYIIYKLKHIISNYRTNVNFVLIPIIYCQKDSRFSCKLNYFQSLLLENKQRMQHRVTTSKCPNQMIYLHNLENAINEIRMSGASSMVELIR